MKVFNPEQSAHTLRIIPREYVTVGKLVIRDELKNISTTLALEPENESGYLTAPFTYTFREAASYELTVTKQDNTILYRGKAYATASADHQNYKLTQ